MVDAPVPKAGRLDALLSKGRYTISAGLCFGVSLFRFYQYPKIYVLDVANLAQASDHRPVVMHFLLP